MSALPAGWTTTSIADIALFNPKAVAEDTMIAGFAPMQLLGTRYRDRMIFEERPWGEIKKAYVHFQPGDVIVAKVTPCFENGKAGIAPPLPNGLGAGSSEFCVLRPAQGIDERYLLAWLSTEDFRRRATVAMTGSVGLKRVPKEVFLSERIPLAPEAEQRRIADKLDAVLTRVDAVNTRLARAAHILKRFRQSVLAAAISGRLTEDWRADSQPDAGDTPLHWERTTLRHCVVSITGGASPSVEDYAPTGVLALNKGDIKPYGLLARKKDQKRVPREFAELHRAKLVQQGALLVTLRDLSNKADFLGLIAQYMGTEVALPTQGMYALTVAENTVPNFLMHFSNSPKYREVMKREKVGATQVHLRNDQFLDISISLPPVAEQAEIVRRVETLFAFADRLEARLQAAQTATERLTPALFAKAFSGELVPQDASDEPASELLRRLQKESWPTSKKIARKGAA